MGTQAPNTRPAGGTVRSRFGTVLMLVGLALLVYSFGAYVGLLPGGYSQVPRPVALGDGQERAVRLDADPTEPIPDMAPAGSVFVSTLPPPVMVTPAAEPPIPVAAIPPAASEPRSTQPPPAMRANPPDSEERRQAALMPRPGIPIRLELPSIAVETEVKRAGWMIGSDGEPEWETLPFVAANYPMLGPVGGPGNPVISGHVVTLYEGNVFRDLYQVQLGDLVRVYTADSRFVYRVQEIRLVDPADISVMAPTEDARLTLVTCGGTFDPRSRTFSERLIVVGKLVGGERL